MFEKLSIIILELIISVNNLVNKVEFNYQILDILYKNLQIYCEIIMYNVFMINYSYFNFFFFILLDFFWLRKMMYLC